MIVLVLSTNLELRLFEILFWCGSILFAELSLPFDLDLSDNGFPLSLSCLPLPDEIRDFEHHMRAFPSQTFIAKPSRGRGGDGTSTESEEGKKGQAEE